VPLKLHDRQISSHQSSELHGTEQSAEELERLWDIDDEHYTQHTGHAGDMVDLTNVPASHNNLK
jgi:hypothetical protein